VKYSLEYLADAFQAFFAGGGYPRFKSKYHTQDGFTIPSEVKVSDSHLYVLKAGWLRVKGHNPYADCPPRQARIRQEGTKSKPKWYGYITYIVSTDLLCQDQPDHMPNFVDHLHDIPRTPDNDAFELPSRTRDYSPGDIDR